MPRTKHAGKVDINQPEIVQALRKAGASVLSLASLGQGVPDLLVADPHGKYWMLEVKGEHGKLTADQELWIYRWTGPVYIVRSADEALRVIGVMG
jgi:hypothetical protein